MCLTLCARYAPSAQRATGFATSLSIILSSVLSAFIPAFNFAPTRTFVLGSTLVILATILYSTQQAAPVPPKNKAAMFEVAAARSFELAAASGRVNGRNYGGSVMRPGASKSVDTV